MKRKTQCLSSISTNILNWKYVVDRFSVVYLDAECDICICLRDKELVKWCELSGISRSILGWSRQPLKWQYQPRRRVDEIVFNCSERRRQVMTPTAVIRIYSSTENCCLIGICLVCRKCAGDFSLSSFLSNSIFIFVKYKVHIMHMLATLRTEEEACVYSFITYSVFNNRELEMGPAGLSGIVEILRG